MLLNCHTYYSFGYGTYAPQALLEQARAKGYTTFALTDINNTSACLDTLRRAQEAKYKVVLGIDFRNETEQKYIGLAINNNGFKELNEHLSYHLQNVLPFDTQAPGFNNVYIVYPFAAYVGWPLSENEYISVTPRDLSSLAFQRIKCTPHKLVALHTVSFQDKRNFNAHRLLRAASGNTLLSKLAVSEQGLPEHTLPHPSELEAAYAKAPHLLQNAQRLLSECSVKFDYGKLTNKNPKFFTKNKFADVQKLRQLCEEGIAYRYHGAPKEEVWDRTEKELAVISQMGFASYFLINWDIIKYAQHKGYYYVGRGSGANSMVAYLLRITDVDPLELDLYFERFINLHRTNPPDFDIDFSWTDRDDVTRYIFETHTDKKVALLGAYSTYQHDAVIRELGKVFGLPPGEIDKLQDTRTPRQPDGLGHFVLQYAEVLQGFPSHMSIHSSGILISHEPIQAYSATFMPPKGFPTTQFSMLEAEDIGLYKFDILSQRGLGKIKDSLEIISQNRQVEVDIHDLEHFKRDESVKNMLRTGKTIGCFYVESPAMRMLFTKLQADDFIRLVAASSIIRPGVAKSGMMQQYIERFRNKEARNKARAALPEFYDILAETYGVMVYQEDVIKVAHEFAKLDLAEADYLRRGMSWKFKQRNEFHKVKQKFFDNCNALDYPDKLVSDIWYQIESFGNFAFSKGHSASYAVESYQAMYLKAHYPLEYMVATLNNGGGFYRPELYLHEARLCGATVHPPCVNNSLDICTIQGIHIWLGLAMVRSIEHETHARILNERKENGLFIDLPDFMHRLPVGTEQLQILVRVGAFSFTGISKKELLWSLHMLRTPAKTVVQQELFQAKPKAWRLPKLDGSPADEAFDEIELLGFPLCSPFTLLREALPSHLSGKELHQQVGKSIVAIGYLVTTKPTRTSRGDRMAFGTFIDQAGDWIDTVHFPTALQAYPFVGPGCYQLKGKMEVEHDFVYLNIVEMHHLAVVNLDD